MKKLLMLVLTGLLTVAFSLAQQVVTGTVTDSESGGPLEGASVIVKGTTLGVLTGSDGKYKLSMPKNSNTLIVSYVGKKTVEQAVSGSSLDIAMLNDVMQVDEVVVTALGISRQEKELGYAAQTVGGTNLVNSRETNLVSAMSGKIAGVQITNSSGAPGSSSFIRIRGNNSLSGNNQPLFVIDGVPVDNTQNATGNPDNGSNQFLDGVANSNRAIDIDPNNIESMTVLKGAAATALYGIRAANGAIIITTKRGAAKGHGMEISYNGTFTADQVNKLPELQSEYSQGRGGIYRGPNFAVANPASAALVFRSWGALNDTLVYNGEADYPWDPNGSIVGKSTNPSGKAINRYDNPATFFQTGQTWSHNVALAGGTGSSTYRLSASRLTQEGIIPNSTFERTSFSLSGSSSLTSKLRVSSTINYVNSGGQRTQTGSNVSGIMLGLLRTPNTFDNSYGIEAGADGFIKAYEFEDGTQRQYTGVSVFDNPYWTVYKNLNRDNVNRVYGFGQVDYLPTDWLSITYRLGTDFYSDDRSQVFAIGSNANPAGQISRRTYLYQHLNSDLFITATKKFGDIETRLMVGHNYYNRTNSSNYVQGDGMTIPDFNHVSNTSSVLNRYALDRYRSYAMFLDGMVGYKGWLYLNGSFRRDNTSVFDGNGFAYGGASLGLVFTEALGMTDNKVLSFGKFRANYATVGNDQGATFGTQNYFTQAAYSDGWTNGVAFPFNGVPGFTMGDGLGNPNLRPEKTSTFETGVDLRFFENRVGIDLTYYNSKSIDQILFVPIAASTGYLSVLTNAGTVTNKGIEMVLTGSPIRTKDFNWDVTVNFTRNRNMVEELAESIEAVQLGGFEGSDIRAVAGYPYGQIYGDRWLRDGAGRVIINPSTGYPIQDQTTGAIGNPNPDFLMGINNQITWKGVSVGFLFDWRKGGDIWNGTRGALYSYGTHGHTAVGRRDSVIFGSDMTLINGAATKPVDSDAGTSVDYYNGMFDGAVYGRQNADNSVTYLNADGTESTTAVANTKKAAWGEAFLRAGLGNGFNGPTDQFIEDGSFFRLRELNVSYTFDKALFEGTPFGGASITFTGRNLALWTKYTGIDPETSLVGSRNAQGLDYFNLPNTKSYGVAVNLKF